MTFFGGQRVAAQREVDYLFEDPPHSLQVQHGTSLTRIAVMQGKGGYRSTTSYLSEHGEPARAAENRRAAARAVPGDADTMAVALQATELAQGMDAAIGFAREALAQRPGRLRPPPRVPVPDAPRRPHRGDARRVPRPLRSRPELRRRRRAPRPRRAGRRGPRLADEVVKAHPGDAHATFMAAWFAHQAGDHATADALLSKVTGDPFYERYLHDHALSLVALHRTPDALALVAHAIEKENDGQLHTALLYHQLARLPDAGSPPAPPLSYLEALATKPGGEAVLPLAWSLVGEARGTVKIDRPRDNETAQVVQIHVAAGNDPAQAWKLCADAAHATLGRVFPTVAILLAAEFARAGDQALAERMLLGRPDILIPPSAILEQRAHRRRAPRPVAPRRRRARGAGAGARPRAGGERPERGGALRGGRAERPAARHRHARPPRLAVPGQAAPRRQAQGEGEAAALSAPTPPGSPRRFLA